MKEANQKEILNETLLKILKSNLRKMQAVEILEYEDKNYLWGDNKKRSEEMQYLHNHSIMLIEKLIGNAEKTLKR